MNSDSASELPPLLQPEDICEGEWADWYRLTPLERWRETEKLWALYLSLGGSLDPEPDTQSPFHDALAAFNEFAPPSPKLHLKRRGGI